MPVISKFTVGGHPVTKYNNQRLRQFVINGETCPFAKVAESLNGTLPDPISYRIHRLQASGNSSQSTGSVPKYNCQGASSVLNIGSIIASDVMTVPNTNHGITATFNATNGTWVCTGTSDAVSFVSLYNQITLTSGHKYLVPAYRDATQAATTYYRWGGKAITSVPAANFYWPDQSSSRSWAIITGDGTTGYCTFTFRSGLDTEVSGFEPAGCFNLIDLTQLYGAGNEPANPETVFQDYPEIPVGNDSWIKNDVIRSISSITLGGHTVSVDLRSAGSVYDEWASNSRGTRKVGKGDDFSALVWTLYGTNTFRCASAVSGAKYNDGTATPNILVPGYTATPYSTVLTDMWVKMFEAGGTKQIIVKDTSCATVEDFQEKVNGLPFLYELATLASFTAGSPLTLSSGLTPTDQDGDAVTFTEETEATPSPNYPVPIVNSSLISITDGQDTNSASIDLAGLTDKDQVYVNVKSTNLFDEVMELGNIDYTTGADGASTTQLRSKNYIPVDAETDYYLAMPGSDNIRLFAYDSEKNYIGSYKIDATWQTGSIVNSESPNNASFTTPQDCAFLRFFTTSSYGTTYNHDISIALYNGSPVPYMPHNTKGKVWYKAWVGKYTFTGSEVWTARATSSVAKCYSASGLFGGNGKSDNSTEGYCTVSKIGNGDVPNAPNKILTDVSNAYIAIPTDMTPNQCYPSGAYVLYPLRNPVWSDITSSAMGAALLALETMEETSNTITINNSGVIDMVQYFTPI